MPERFAELGVPLQRMYIEEHRAGSVAVIGHMDAPAGQIPDKPCVHRAEEQLAALGALSRAGDVVEDPAQLCAGEIGVDQKAGLFADLLFPAIGAQLLAQRRRPAALPDDRVVHGAARFLFPDDRRLALVGDADGGDVRGGKAARAECLRQTRTRAAYRGSSSDRAPPSRAADRSARRGAARATRPSRSHQK